MDEDSRNARMDGSCVTTVKLTPTCHSQNDNLYEAEKTIKTFSMSFCPAQSINPLALCARVLCRLFCPEGFEKDEQGCDTCQCKKKTTPAQTCSEVVGNFQRQKNTRRQTSRKTEIAWHRKNQKEEAYKNKYHLNSDARNHKVVNNCKS